VRRLGARDGANVRSCARRAASRCAENPPAHVYLGDLHLLDYFARVADGADSGLLLDVAHLAIYQRASGHAPLDGLDGFPLERVVEVHVAGASEFAHAGRSFVDDDHGPPAGRHLTILEAVLPRASNLCALVYGEQRRGRGRAHVRAPARGSQNHRAVQRAVPHAARPGFEPRRGWPGAEELAPPRRPISQPPPTARLAAGQFLRNVSEEFAPVRPGCRPTSWASSPEFHDAAATRVAAAFGAGGAVGDSFGAVCARRARARARAAASRARRSAGRGDRAAPGVAGATSRGHADCGAAAPRSTALSRSPRRARAGPTIVVVPAERSPAPFRLRASRPRSSRLTSRACSVVREPRTRHGLGAETAEIVAELLADGVLPEAA
jgi:hypothetical protein